MIRDLLQYVSVAALLLGLGCAAIIGIDEFRTPQRMWIMNVVWPASALFGTVFVLYGYRTYGKLATKQRATEGETPSGRQIPFPVMVAKGALHCGSGCTLGDICAEWLAFGIPAIAFAFGWQSLFQEKMFAVWIFDYILAFAFGTAFQYFTIKPMRGLGPGEGIMQALKADTLSLTAWQVGMYGFMALAQFWIFRRLLGVELKVDSFAFWFMMQIAMVAGFVTAYPANWWLIRTGVKEKM